MGMGKFEFVFVVIVTILEIAWIISELVALSGVNDSNDAIVFGHIEDSKRKGYVYFSAVCCFIYMLTRISAYAILKEAIETYVHAALFIAVTSLLGALLYEIPVTVLVHLVAKCRNDYLIRAQIASRVMHTVAVIARVAFVAIITVKSIRKRDSKETCSIIATCLVALLYFGGAACIVGLSCMTLKDHKLINDYEPHISDTSVMFVPPGTLPSTPVSKFPIGATLSARGSTTDHFIVLVSLTDLVNSGIVHSRSEGSGKHRRTVEGRFLKASLDCKIIPSALQPTGCNDTLQFNFRYDKYSSSSSLYSGKVHFSCGLRERGQCKEECPPLGDGWTLRLVNRIRRNTTAGTDDSLITTPWQEVTSCGETPVQLDEDMSACRSSSLTASGVLLLTCCLVLWFSFER